jgi:hypothetical protein
MFSFNSLRRFLAQSVSVLIALCALLVFSGCPTEAKPDTGGFVLEGKWVSDYDSYTITKTAIEYGDDFGSIVKGTVEKQAAFSGNSGVIIFKATEVTGTFYPYTPGKYGAVYYSEGTKNSIKLANAIDSLYAPIEKNSLSEAEDVFTTDNVGTHVSMWGSYTKQ